MSAERWLPVNGAPGYEVSDQGRVRSWLPGRGRSLPYVLATWHSPYCGYMWTKVIYADGGSKAVAIHRLVAAAFLGPRPEGMVTRHLDGDDRNNRLSNLRYGTPRENNLDTVAHGRHRFAERDECKNGHPFTPENTAPRSDCGGRVCKQCNREASLAYYHRKQSERMGASR